MIDRRTYYDWPGTWSLIRSLQPDAVIFSDVGPDIRWVGNESGFANETCWATYDPIGEDGGPAAPGYVRAELGETGTRHGSHWMPPECDVSIRPGWFWHAAEDTRVKSPAEIMNIYYRSVGHGASLLLNVPPDRRGLLHENDVDSLRGFGQFLSSTFAKNLAAQARVTATSVRMPNDVFRIRNLVDGDPQTYWSTDDGVTMPQVVFEFDRPVTFNVARLRENIRLGQRVEGFAVDQWNQSSWKSFAQGTSVGACRLFPIPEGLTTSRVRLRVTQCPVCPAMTEFGLYQG